MEPRSLTVTEARDDGPSTAASIRTAGFDDDRRHIVVVGLDELHRRQLESLPHPWTFHGLFHADELKRGDRFPMDELLEDGPRRLREAAYPIDAVVGYWDFPVSTTLPILRRSIGLPTTSLESVLACEHKYWSRLRQRDHLPELVPEFCLVDPFADDPCEAITLDFPFWIKPIKSLRSHLAFRIDEESDLQAAIGRIRDGIDRYGDAFDRVLERACLPSEVADVSGSHCIAEAIIPGDRQCTVEGYVLEGRASAYGVIDSFSEGRSGSSLTSYRYPSTIPDEVERRMRRTSESLMEHLSYGDGPFNIEYFWHRASGALGLLEVNPRISKSHAPLFQLVDGRHHHEVMVSVALGRRPEMPHRRGEYAAAAKFMTRTYRDGEVTRVPTPQEIETIERDLDGVSIHLDVSEGDRLSDLHDQDPYSFEVAQVFVGGRSHEHAREKYEECLSRLQIQIDGDPIRA